MIFKNFFFQLTRNHITAFLITLITFLVYLPALQNGFVNFDDPIYVTENINIRTLDLGLLKWSFTSKVLDLWHPISFLSLALDFAVWGQNPTGYHLSNIVLHALNTFIVYILAVSLIKSGNYMQHKETLFAGCITAFLFGIHPLHVESVAWVSERKDLLCAFFFLSSIISYLRYVSEKSGVVHYLISLLLFALAVMSKPMAISLPIVLLILDYFPMKRLTVAGKTIKTLMEKIPFFFIGAIPVLITLWPQDSTDAINMAARPFTERLLMYTYGSMFYLIKMISPSDLAPFYPIPAREILQEFRYLGSGILLFLISLYSITSLRHGKLFFCCWLYYIATLIPVMGIIGGVPQSMADRYTYLPSLGPFLLSGVLVVTIYGRIAKKYKIATISVLLLYSVILINKSIDHIGVWRDSTTFWSYEEKLYPKSLYHFFNSIGVNNNASGNFNQAVIEFSKAMEIDPENESAYNNRGYAYIGLGRYNEAVKDLSRAIELEPREARAYTNRGYAYSLMGRYKEAIADLNKAIELNPNRANTYNNRGYAYNALGIFNQSIEDLSKAIELNPRLANAFNNRASAYDSLGQHTQAIDDLSEAIKLDPKYASAYLNRGIIYTKLHNYQDAMVDFSKCIELNPRDAVAYRYLGYTYRQSGNLEKAIYYEKIAAETNIR